MKARYALVALFGVAMCFLCFAMVVYRAEIEPAVRFLHPFLLGRRSAEPYQSGDYIFYQVLVGIFGVISFVALAYGRATKARTDRKIDRYMADRLPRHETTKLGDKP